MSVHIYQIRPRKDKRGVDLICDLLPFGRLWHGEPNAISNARFAGTHRWSATICVRVIKSARSALNLARAESAKALTAAPRAKAAPQPELVALSDRIGMPSSTGQ
jgi:hypothetical protein